MLPATPVVAQTAPGRTELELIVTKGKYKGKRGWMDKTRGKDGYSPSGLSVYITYLDEHNCERRAQNYVRTKSIMMTNWSEVAARNTGALARDPNIATHVSQLCGMFQRLVFPTEAAAIQCREELLETIETMLNITPHTTRAQQ